MCSNTNIACCYIKTLQSNLQHTTVWNHWSVKFNLHIQGSLSCKENEENKMIYTNKQIRLNNLKKWTCGRVLWCLQYSFQVMTLLTSSEASCNCVRLCMWQQSQAPETGWHGCGYVCVPNAKVCQRLSLLSSRLLALLYIYTWQLKASGPTRQMYCWLSVTLATVKNCHRISNCNGVRGCSVGRILQPCKR